MKLELDENSYLVIVVVAICLTVITLSWIMYRYNALVYEKGYTPIQLQGTTTVVWTKGQQ